MEESHLAPCCDSERERPTQIFIAAILGVSNCGSLIFHKDH